MKLPVLPVDLLVKITFRVDYLSHLIASSNATAFIANNEWEVKVQTREVAYKNFYNYSMYLNWGLF